MNTVLVTSTADGIGKTAISLAIGRLAQERGLDVGYMKPKGTRLESTVGKTRDEDPMLAREVLGLDAEMHELEPVVYSPTFIEQAMRGREDPSKLAERIESSFDGLAADRDLMVLEGAGSPWIGGIVDLTDRDIAALLDAEVLLLTGYDRSAQIDDVLAIAEHFGDRLAGVLFNEVSETDTDRLVDDVLSFLDSRDVRTLGYLPRDAELAGVTVADMAEQLGADVVTQEAPLDHVVERMTVGAMGGDSALEQFRRSRNTAMITGGDRSDVQLAALEASGVNCLLLTGGYQPASTFVGRAEDHGVPILVVQSDTRTTIDRAENAFESGRTRNPETVARMVDLLETGFDIDALLDDDPNPDT
jgi:BioD-like phosphotransacetylase family protein